MACKRSRVQVPYPPLSHEPPLGTLEPKDFSSAFFENYVAWQVYRLYQALGIGTMRSTFATRCQSWDALFTTAE